MAAGWPPGNHMLAVTLLVLLAVGLVAFLEWWRGPSIPRD
jgi:hypothetical protein